jgi:hypothetical protein
MGRCEGFVYSSPHDGRSAQEEVGRAKRCVREEKRETHIALKCMETQVTKRSAVAHNASCRKRPALMHFPRTWAYYGGGKGPSSMCELAFCVRFV